MSSHERCPRCGGTVMADRRTQESSCLQCGYEYICSTPVGLNPSTWSKRIVKLPVYGTRKDVPENGNKKSTIIAS